MEDLPPRERPHIEADGTVSWLPADGVRLDWLEVARPDPKGGWLRTFHSAPAEIWRSGRTFYIRKPKRAHAAAAWHTLTLHADPRHARVEECDDAWGRGARVIFEEDPTDVRWPDLRPGPTDL
ncbi:MAG: hypothetical protein IRZ18_08105 [Clostridia bacterium]|nr:hypothetical protein [Clostridia bacterium]